jgi:CRISPR-associated endonuclease/helicase Cas3
MCPYRTLLAKGWTPTPDGSPPAEARLLPHLRSVEASAAAIVNAGGATILANLGLDVALWIPRLRLSLRLAALLHDLGKANSYFQGMVRGKPDHPPTAQPIRHELLSVLILLRNTGGIADWLRRQIAEAGQSEVSDELFRTIIGAVAGHHVKMDEEWTKAFNTERGGGTAITLYLGHTDLQPLFGDATRPKDETWPLLKNQPAFPGRSQSTFNIGNVEWQDHLDATPEWKRFAAAVKALTMAADVAGSALLPQGIAIKGWIADALGRRATAGKLREVAIQRLAGRPERPFQSAIAATSCKVTLVEAGCGSGKTAAAWLWAANHAQGRKLFFCYPTTGTATEGFLGYVAESKVEGELVHSRAVVDLERVATSREDDHEDRQLRIESLRMWAPEAVVCTIDTVLALVRNNRRGLYGSPAILAGAFIFDELHAYDDTLFAAVIALIRALPGAPFLLMSASLPAHRKVLLQDKLGEIGTIQPPAELEAIPRYRLRQTDRTDAFTQAAERVRKGERVLWVCNVVARAQAVFDQADNAGLPVVTYHSRFRYKDRVDRHRDVVDGFSATETCGLLAVTTQVAEMSLDLDADLLITELAPFPALIQRLGRLNRRVSEENPGTPRLALVIPPESDPPYEPEELATACAWLVRLGTQPSSGSQPVGGSEDTSPAISQRDLAKQFIGLADAKPSRLRLETEWLDSGWNAWPGKIRDAGFSVNVILPEDAEACRRNGQEIIKRSLPMPYKSRMEGWATLRGAFIAPPDAIQYDDCKGATWAD